MSRRSSRLVSGGYYNSDEESDSSSVTNISYRENPVKVFKKKAGTRKSGPRTSNSSPSQEPPLSPEVPSPSPAHSRTQPVTRTVSFTTATPRPALTPSSSRSQTPTCSSLPPADKTPYPKNSTTNRPALYVKPHQEDLSQSGVDSSGYSSSEGTREKTCSGGRGSSDGDVAPSDYMSRISSTFLYLKDNASVLAGAARKRLTSQSVLASAPLSRGMKKAIGLLLLLILILLCIWFLLPVLSSIISSIRPTKTPTPTAPIGRPVVIPTAPPPSCPPPPPPPHPSTVRQAPVVDPAVVSAVVEAKIQNALKDLHKNQEQFLSQMTEQSRLHMKDMQVKLEVMDSNSQTRLKQEVSVLLRQMSETQTFSQSAADSLALRIQTLEAQNSKLSQELSSLKLTPFPVPCPESNSVHDRLTPELQEAVEKWLSQRVKEQDELRLRDAGSCADSGRPMADKMADFALETQGASVVSTRCSETYRIRSACVTLFGFPLWYPSESPRTVIQGFPVLLPGKCWAFHGVEGTLVIALSHPVRISHVTLDHLPRYNSPTGRIDSAPKDFEVYGMENDTEEGTLLGTFTYDQNGDSTQTFKLTKPSEEVHTFVELRVLSNWGHIEYTCLYRFRVHGTMESM